MFCDPVVGHHVGQVENLDIGEDARCAAGGGDVDVDGTVGDALQALCAVGAELRADEEFDLDGAVRGGFDEVLEDDETIIVLVVLVGVGGGAQCVVRRRGTQCADPASIAATVRDFRADLSM
jgi:hypothetical protein